MGFEGSGSFLGAAASIAAGIGSFIAHWFGITAKELLRLITFLKDNIVQLSQALLNGVLKLGRSLARAVVSLLRLAVSGIRTLAVWASRKLVALEQFLKAKFKPILAWLAKVKDHLDDLYKKYIRPIIDTIEFIRALNRVLQTFHINVLRQLDATLAKIEQKIELPYEWIRSHITEVENWINRIVTADGLFQRVALVRSMGRTAPAWIKGFYNAQIAPSWRYPDVAPSPGDQPSTITEGVAAAREYFERGAGPLADDADRGLAQFLELLDTN